MTPETPELTAPEAAAPDPAPPAEAPAPALEDPLAAAPALEDPLAAVTAERDRLAAENAALHDRLLRRQAEFENFRKRSERDRIDFIQFAGLETVREILPALDDLERATKAPTSDLDFQKGIALIHQRFVDALKRLGLEPVDAAGQPFDPNLHQAVDRETDDSVDENTVLEEYQRGYNFKGKLVRPAMVKVSVKP
ncbi:MAG: nucleotide exchange factor GrpE [Bryobacteraceae bacterium]